MYNFASILVEINIEGTSISLEMCMKTSVFGQNHRIGITAQ